MLVSTVSEMQWLQSGVDSMVFQPLIPNRVGMNDQKVTKRMRYQQAQVTKVIALIFPDYHPVG